MKIRIAGNSVRFRLRQPEVAHFYKTGGLIEKIEFGQEEQDQLRFCLARYSGAELDIRYEKRSLTILVPESLLERWVTTELVGFDGELDTKKNRLISVLIEKDFACLDANVEENEGAYPNPLANCQTTESAH
jgi:hypothetical protein